MVVWKGDLKFHVSNSLYLRSDIGSISGIESLPKSLSSSFVGPRMQSFLKYGTDMKF